MVLRSMKAWFTHWLHEISDDWNFPHQPCIEHMMLWQMAYFVLVRIEAFWVLDFAPTITCALGSAEGTAGRRSTILMRWSRFWYMSAKDFHITLLNWTICCYMIHIDFSSFIQVFTPSCCMRAGLGTHTHIESLEYVSTSTCRAWELVAKCIWNKRQFNFRWVSKDEFAIPMELMKIILLDSTLCAFYLVYDI